MAIYWLIYMALRYLMGIVSVVLNLFTLGCVISKSYLRSSASLLIASLAMGDLLRGLLVAILLPIAYLGWSTGVHTPTCLASSCIEATAIFTQFTSFTMLAFERRNSLLFQLNRSEKWSRLAVLVVLILMWVLIILYNVTITVIIRDKIPASPGCSFINNYPAYFSYIALSVYITATVLVLVGYGHIAVIAYKSSNQVNPAESVTQQAKRKNDMKITKMMVLVVGVSFMLYLPFVVNTATKTPSSPPWQQVLYQVSILIFDVNFWINPFIYAWRDKSFKRAFHETIAACRRLCCCCCCCCPPLQEGAGPAVVHMSILQVPTVSAAGSVSVNANVLVPRDPLITVSI